MKTPLKSVFTQNCIFSELFYNQVGFWSSINLNFVLTSRSPISAGAVHQTGLGPSAVRHRLPLHISEWVRRLGWALLTEWVPCHRTTWSREWWASRSFRDRRQPWSLSETSIRWSRVRICTCRCCPAKELSRKSWEVNVCYNRTGISAGWTETSVKLFRDRKEKKTNRYLRPDSIRKFSGTIFLQFPVESFKDSSRIEWVSGQRFFRPHVEAFVWSSDVSPPSRF